MGPTTDAEVAVVGALLQEQSQELTLTQVSAIGRVLRRRPAATKALIARAKAQFRAEAPHYVEVHRQAMDQALKLGDAKGLEVATRASQWAIERISQDGERIVEAAPVEGTGVKVFVGVKIGGLQQKDES